MNYTYMQTFYVVAKLQNISLASKELGVTQPAVSRIISNLEKEYKTKLFVRSKYGVTLTREGLNLFEMIKEPFSDLERIDSTAISSKNFSKNIIHVGTTATALYVYLFNHLDGIKESFPNINFNIYTNSSTNLLKMLNDGKIDFAFVTTPFNYGDDLEIDNIVELDDILIAPMSYKDKLKGEISIKNLDKYPFILLNREMQFREHVNKFLSNNGTKIIPAYEIDSSSTLLKLVENDFGLSFIPYQMAKSSIDEGKCFKVNLIEELPPRYIAFAIKKDKTHSSVVYELKRAILGQE